MRKTEGDDIKGGFLLLLLAVVALHAFEGVFALSVPVKAPSDSELYLQISGDIRWPGVYGFLRQPNLRDLITQAGGFRSKGRNAFWLTSISCRSGEKVEFKSDGQKTRIIRGEMPGFYKMTLGIPLSLNNESLEGLTALPGVGPRIAGSIVRERAKRGGYRKVDDILSIHGIGPRLYEMISPYLVL